MKIYIIKCIETNKHYIGQTMQEGNKRFKAHFSEARNKPKNECVKLNRAIRKYGEGKFVVRDLIAAKTLEELNELESKYIKIFNTVSNGYNSTYGGDGCKCSDETRKKMSDWQKGKPKSEKHKKAMSEYHQNRPKEHQENVKKANLKRCVGSKASDKTKNKMSKSQRKLTDEQIMEILKLINPKVRSYVSISKDYGVDERHISRIANGWRPRG